MTVENAKRKSPKCYKNEFSPGEVPKIVIGRLAIYMREVDACVQEGCVLISSHQLAERIGVSSAQVRKDLSYFGDFGKQGSGYEVSALRAALCKILHIDREWSVVVVGVGQLGRALIQNESLKNQGFRIDAIFDNDRRKIDKWVGTHKIIGVRDFVRYVEALDCRIGIITTPARSAQLVADRMVAAGILCILNYAPTTIYMPDFVHVQSIDPVLHFYQMTYYLTRNSLDYPHRYRPGIEPEISATSSPVWQEAPDKDGELCANGNNA